MLDAVITLKDQFSSTLEIVDQSVKDFSRTTKRLGKDIQSTGRNIAKVGSGLTKSLTAPIAGIGLAAAKVGMDFESGMSQVAATMGITVAQIKAGDKSFEMLSQAAKDMGKATQYSATEASEALNFLALAGLDAEQSVSMLPKVLNLAAAGGLELQYSADLVTDSMAALGLGIHEADRFIDRMARTSQKSNTSVAQLGEGILTVGANAKDLAGGTLELNTALGLLANAGMKGAEGGTKLRNIIMAMTPTTDKAVGAFKALNVETYDLATGEMRKLPNVFGDMNKAMEGMTTENKKNILNSIFNKQDMAGALTLLASTANSVSDLDFALNELNIPTAELGINLEHLRDNLGDYSNEQEFAQMAMEKFGVTAEESKLIYDGLNGVVKDGSSAWDLLESQINDSEGAAKEMADTLMHNLKGAITKVKSALEGLGIRVYENLKPKFDGIVKSVQGFIDKLDGLSDKQLDLVIKFALFLAAIGPTIMIVGRLTTKIGGLVTWFGDLGLKITKAGGLLKYLTSPAMIVVGVITAIIAVGILLFKNWDTIKAKAEEVFPGIGIAVGDAIETIKGTLSTISEFIGNAFTSGIEVAKSVVKTGLEFIKGFWEEHQESILMFIDIFKTIGEVVCESILEIIEAVKPIGEIIGETIGEIMDVISYLIPFLLEVLGVVVGVFVVGFVGGFLVIANQVTAIITTIIGVIEGIVTVLSGIIDFLVGVFTGDWSRAFKGLEKITDGVITVIKSLWQGLKDFLAAPIKAAVDILDKVFKEKAEGVKKIWKDVKTFLKNPISGTVNLLRTGNVDGSHKTGLNRVPFDGYIAELYAGERVLTKQEADNYNGFRNIKQNLTQNKLPDIENVIQNVKQDFKQAKIPNIKDMTQNIKQDLSQTKIPRVKDEVQNIKQNLLEVNFPKIKDAIQTVRQKFIPAEIPKVEDVVQNIKQNLIKVKIPKVRDLTQNIKQVVIGTKNQNTDELNQRVISSPAQHIVSKKEYRTVHSEKTNALDNKTEINIDIHEMTVREEADIDKIATLLARKIDKVSINMV